MPRSGSSSWAGNHLSCCLFSACNVCCRSRLSCRRWWWYSRWWRGFPVWLYGYDLLIRVFMIILYELNIQAPFVRDGEPKVVDRYAHVLIRRKQVIRCWFAMFRAALLVYSSFLYQVDLLKSCWESIENILLDITVGRFDHVFLLVSRWLRKSQQHDRSSAADHAPCYDCQIFSNWR